MFLRDSAFLRIKYYNPVNIILQHVPAKEKVLKNIALNRLRNGFLTDT